MRTIQKVTVVLALSALLAPTISVESQARVRSNVAAQRARQQQLQRQRAAQMETQSRIAWQQQTLDDLDRVVGLTADQKVKLQPIVAAEAKQLEALSKQQIPSADKKAREQEIYQSAWNKAYALLTPDQKIKVDEAAQDKVLDQLDSEVKLTSAQKADIRNILYDESQQISAVRDGKKLSKEKLGEQTQTIDNTTWEKIEQRLTPPQLQKLGATRRSQLLSELSKSLVLNTAQHAQVASILEDAAKQTEALQSDKSLGKDEAFSKHQAINEAMWAKISALLEPWQQQKLVEFRGVSTPAAKSLPDGEKAIALPSDKP